jgi:hypothetical protein
VDHNTEALGGTELIEHFTYRDPTLSKVKGQRSSFSTSGKGIHTVESYYYNGKTLSGVKGHQSSYSTSSKGIPTVESYIIIMARLCQSSRVKSSHVIITWLITWQDFTCDVKSSHVLLLAQVT